jgi:ribosomal-protein-alanine N-acetyltransferase
MLSDRDVLAHRATSGRSLIGFILSRLIAGEAEILSVAVASSRRESGVTPRPGATLSRMRTGRHSPRLD